VPWRTTGNVGVAAAGGDRGGMRQRADRDDRRDPRVANTGSGPGPPSRPLR